jgi:hypothetical protein
VTSVVQPFTEIDDGGTGDVMLTSAVMAPFEVGRTNLFDGITVSLEQFSAPPAALPAGPKAVIVISDGDENGSELSDEFSVLADATENSIPIFAIGVGSLGGGQALLMRLASETGGDYFPAPDDSKIAEAYVTISELLGNEYLLTIPSNISDCADHTLQVSVANQASPASATFARCAPQPPPPPPPSPAPNGGGGGGGGGGTVGATLLLAGLVALAAGRRRLRRAR